MRLFFRRAVVGMVISLLVTGGAAWLVVQAIAAVAAEQRESTEIARFLGRLDRMLLTAVEAESHQRGYAITGATSYLMAYERAVERFATDLAAVRSVAGSATYHEEIDLVDTSFDAWTSMQAEAVIAARREHPVEEVGAGLAAAAAWTTAYADHGAWLAGPGTERPALSTWAARVGEAEQAIATVLAAALTPERRSDWSDVAVDVRAYRRALVGPEARQAAFADAATWAEFADVGTRLAALAAEAERGEARVVALLLTGDGRELMPRIRGVVADLTADAGDRLDASLVAATSRHRSATVIAWAAPVTAVALALTVVVGFLLDVGRHLFRLERATHAVADGEDVEPIGERGPAVLRPFSRDFDRMVGTVKARDVESQGLADLAAVLQAARSVDEVLHAVKDTLTRHLPADDGTVWLVSASRNVMQRVAGWGPSGTRGIDHVDLEACWGLRQGRTVIASGTSALRCMHDHTTDGSTTCAPLVSRDETLGVLSVHRPGTDVPTLHERRLVRVVAEHMALALANVRLREALERQSNRDALTGLFNRRFLEHTLELEVHRARRTGAPLAVIMVDVDRFKAFNDTHGHEAGDAVLRSVGSVLAASVRSGDVACRYGGEEFLLLLPGADESVAATRAETVRQGIAGVDVTVAGRRLPGVTASLGIAVAEGEHVDASQLLRVADAALYAAKRAGRDRVVVGAPT